MKKDMPLIFELSSTARKAYSLPSCDVPKKSMNEMLPEKFLRQTPAPLPEVSENDVVRHFVSLSHRNHSVDSGFYPLGSCTMKYNPKVNEEIAKFEGFSTIHPYQPVETVQGCLQVMYDLQCMLMEITGMDAVSLQPAAGAHGELTGLMMIKAYHNHRGDVKRTKILVPDSAHGTNPASAAMAGFEVFEIPSNDEGLVDVNVLRSTVNNETAGLMLTNPNTLGLFEKNILEISDIVHKAGGLLYYDGANLNAIMGITRPGDMGFDIAHLNLHKTFSTPHGAGGPGSGPVAVKKELAPFLPYPVVNKTGNSFILNENLPQSIGKVKLFYGQFGILLRAYCYILSLGAKHLKKSSQYAVLNANYLKEKLKNELSLPYDMLCMHEFVLSASNLHDYGVGAMDLAKRMLDEGIHPPTVYFPLIVKEAMMIEPTETESIDSLNQFVKILAMIIQEAKTTPDKLKESPKYTVVGRLNDTLAARKPIVSYKSH